MIQGTVTTIYGPNINTDDIIPALFLQQSYDRAYFKDYAFDKYDAAFRDRCAATTANIVVAGENFGCGSSREQAVYAIKDNDVVCVLAESYPDIFYRNSLSNGLVLITVQDSSVFQQGDELHVDLDAGTIENVTQGGTTTFEMKDNDKLIFKKGGTIGQVRAHLEEMLSAQ